MFGYISGPVITTRYRAEQTEHRYRKRASNSHRSRVCVQDRMMGWVIDRLRVGWTPPDGGVTTVSLPPHAQRSVTMNTGLKMHRHHELRVQWGMDTYVADPYTTRQPRKHLDQATPAETYQHHTQPQCCTSDLNTAIPVLWCHRATLRATGQRDTRPTRRAAPAPAPSCPGPAPSPRRR